MKLIFLCWLPALVSCQPPQENKSTIFEKAESKGRVSGILEEASGLVASKANPGYLWTINDSGNPAEVFLLNDEAEIVMTCKLKKVDNRDWEDITIGPGPVAGKNYLYVGEIGDNDAKYDLKYLYRFEEPHFKKDKKITIEAFDTLIIKLPDGARDMEAMAVDQVKEDIYFVSKREENVNVYWLHGNELITRDTLIPEKLISLPYHNTVAFGISFDSGELLLKTYDELYYWKKADSLSIAQTLFTPPTLLNYTREPQGEAIAWSLDGKGFYTLSESVDNEKAKLYYYKRRVK